MYLAGYRVAMITSGAGSLWLASYFGAEQYNVDTWKNVYQIMSCLMLIGVCATLFANEPIKKNKDQHSSFQFNFLIALIISVIAFFLSLTYFPTIFVQKSLLLNTLGSTIQIILSFGLSILVLNFLLRLNLSPTINFLLLTFCPLKIFFIVIKKLLFLFYF